jgi:hypothetical protein
VGSFHTLHAVVNQTLVSGSGDDGLYLTVEHDHSIELFENSHGKMFMFQHIFAPRLSAPHQPAPIRFMTYNLWNFEKRYSTRMDNVVRQIQAYQPHVIALQEVRYSNWEYPGSGTHSRCYTNLFLSLGWARCLTIMFRTKIWLSGLGYCDLSSRISVCVPPINELYDLQQCSRL